MSMTFHPRLTGVLIATVAAMAIAWPATATERLRVGATFITSGVDPAKGSNGWALTSHGVGENLFTVDRQGTLVPELADKAERTGDLTWVITLKAGRQFSDGTPVTAAGLAAGFERTFANNKAALASGG